MKYKLQLVLFLSVVVLSCGTELPEEVAEAYDKLPKTLDFNADVKPILSDKCFLCHGPDKAKQQADLRLDLKESAYGELVNSPGKRAITPGKLKRSEVYHRIISEDPEYLMPTPKSNLKLSAYEKAVLVKWIEDGAEYKPHWAFVKPEKKDPPEVKNVAWTKNPIDNFIASKLESKNLSPSIEAEKELLLRRVSFDLTGLPPSPKEIKAFLDDTSANAYERQVDRLLNSLHYGEKMAMDWMDLARYADTHGYTVDRYRDMSPWRDWVIKAFNENMPYDKFILWQIAGDLLPNPTKDQILATAFNRNHPQNMEGGIVPEEFRVEYVLNRVNTAGQAFMALTVSCAKCHDHKYDPISQKSYYEMSSFFNNVNEAGQISFDNATPVPTMLLTSEKQEEILAFLESDVATKEEKIDATRLKERTSFERWLALEKYKKDLDLVYPKSLIAHFELENSKLGNRLNPLQRGIMKQQGSTEEKPEFVKGRNGNGLLLNGDAWFDTQGIGSYRKSQPFSIGLNIKIPQNLKNGVIFHKGEGAALYCFKGFHLALKNNRLQLLMAHNAPDNAIIEYTKQEVPRDVWLNFILTYDGSGSASGFRIYQNGKELKTEVENDNLYKDIHFKRQKEPGIQVGARWRGKGMGGAVVDDLMIFNSELSPLEILQLTNHASFKEILSKGNKGFSEQEKALLETYFLFNYSNAYKIASSEIEEARKIYADSVENIKEIMVMKEMSERRKTYILKRGIYDAYGEEVFPNTPESILPMPGELPKNRIGFAQWLAHPDHPLTARVTVNRYWQNYFGRGIVRTTEDFGNQGELPSHPDLLDWLAIEFMDSGWDIKALQKLIVMSATYRQRSKASEELLELDKENVLLARGPSVRLSAEMIRDNALLASGLLYDKIGGQSVKPYQPKGLWRVNGYDYHRDTSNKLYRRSMYTIWKRSVPHPTLATFDAPERSECTVRRQKTNTPLQALVLLNDPTYVEASRVMGESISRHTDMKTGISQAYLKLTGRMPNDQELSILLELQQKEYTKFKLNPDKAMGWLNTGEYTTDGSLDRNLIAANAIVASVIMNSDASIMKR
ncbi:DUF1553 domain-containing protein [Fulvivirgaceae bacterium BMA10]|uniref:DUF1553 domain-containing protein n=1 Tax=Splendidivirga corallicola TaxID=3051826 RepID=A0ABT8KSI4_9BACT|nr:DUF1553 domain-containing protein [Fulvivirgaceae bacterium BMA10]